MNKLEQQLHYPLDSALPEPGHTLAVAPGVRWVRMALPFALDHINLWLLRDEIAGVQGWTIVDCGIANDTTRSAWEQVFATQLGGLPVLRVIVTHMHPDHIGLSSWLTERWQCRLWISATDYLGAKLACQSTTGFGGDVAARFMASHGLNKPEALEKIRARGSYFSSMVPGIPAAYRRLLNGQTVRIGGHDWHCHVGYGHAPEHMALHCPSLGVMISGDMLLPRISTNVSVTDMEPEGDPLTLYLSSLDRLRPLPGNTLVLPSHGRPFTGMHTRIDQLHQHHADRYAEVREACASGPQSAANLLSVLFKHPLDLHQTTFAMGEAIAHLHALWHRGELQRSLGADGVWRFGSDPGLTGAVNAE
jgi:glyoxylase-like metal-dependent hydrolase (beta-lactamase superfamily II)